MSDFVDRRSVVRKIWGDPDLILLIFAGAAAEFALNRAVDWLFFTGEIPRDPIGRLFSTVRYAQKIVFVSEEQARQTLNRINAIHGAVEQARGAQIPDWAHRDVLYMLIDYSERAYTLLYGPLSPAQRDDLYGVFRRVGEGLGVTNLPSTYATWLPDRRLHLTRDLIYSRHTALLFRQYRRHLGSWRYQLLLWVQTSLVPEKVRELLGLSTLKLPAGLARTYGAAGRFGLRQLVRRALIHPRYWAEVEAFERNAPGRREVKV